MDCKGLAGSCRLKVSGLWGLKKNGTIRLAFRNQQIAA